jgi:hypothetical protein
MQRVFGAGVLLFVGTRLGLFGHNTNRHTSAAFVIKGIFCDYVVYRHLQQYNIKKNGKSVKRWGYTYSNKATIRPCYIKYSLLPPYSQETGKIDYD